MDVCSGSVHIVDELVYDVIALYEEYSKEDIIKKLPQYTVQEIKEAVSEVDELAKNGQLFTKDTYEAYIMDFKKRHTVVKALCIHAAHACNLSCRYCFAEEGEYHGKRTLLSREVGQKAIDFLIANSGDRKNLEVDFFGGEPLLNFQVIKDIVAYGRSLEEKHHKQFRFTLTTNGILLDKEIMEFVNQEMENVVLSIDGRKEVHDAMRPTPADEGSYDLIMPRFIEMANMRFEKDYYVRSTFTHNNLDFAKDVLHLADMGFQNLSLEPVVADEKAEYAITKEDLSQVLKEYDRLAKEMIRRKKEGKGFCFFHFMIDLTGGPCLAKRLSGCGAGTEYLAVTPWGDLYPCHQFVGMKEFLLGSVEEGIQNIELTDEFKLCNVYAKDQCRECFARFYCSGGCIANAYQFQGNLLGTYDIGCEMERKRVECAIMIKAALSEK